MAKIVRIKKQAGGLGSPESGAGSFEIRIRPGQGMQRTAATIERQILDRSGMKSKARQGSIQAPIAYETELEAKNAGGIFGGVLGCTVTAAITVANTDVTDITITGTGTIATTSSGNLITLGIRAGMLIKFTNLSVAGNNSVWVPVLSVTALGMVFAPGIIADNASDSAFSFVTMPCYKTPTPRLKEYYTVEERDDANDISKLGSDARFINLQISIAANQVTQLGFGLLGRDMEPIASGSSPVLSDPGATQGDALLLLDGALYKGGVAAAKVTALTLGLQAQGIIVPLATDRIGADVGVSQFAFSATLNELVNDYSALQAAIDEDQIALMMMLAHRNAPSDVVGIYAGNCSYAQSNDQVADDDSTEFAQAATLYGGKDERGDALGYAATTLLISTQS